MQELIKYISDILNIKTESVYTIQDMTDELSQVKDIVAYRSYIRDNIKNIDVDYTTGFQKFIILTRKYLDMENDAFEGAEKKQIAKELCAKIDSCRSYIEDTNGAFSKVKKTDGSFLFNEQDIRIMRTSGSAMYIIEASKCHTLEDRFIEVLRIRKQPKPYEQLPERMANMIANTTKSIT